MHLSPIEIRTALAALAARPWPETWSKKTSPLVGGDYYGWCHRYLMNAPLTNTEVRAFERRHHISLPLEYREFLLLVGNGGAGPEYGIFPLGTLEERPLPAYMLKSLSRSFNARNAEVWELSGETEENEENDVMGGTLTIATQGCALWFCLVITGPSAGEIWYDGRADGQAPRRLLTDGGEPMRFDVWFESWLHACLKKWAPAWTRHALCSK